MCVVTMLSGPSTSTSERQATNAAQRQGTWRTSRRRRCGAAYAPDCRPAAMVPRSMGRWMTWKAHSNVVARLAQQCEQRATPTGMLYTGQFCTRPILLPHQARGHQADTWVHTRVPSNVIQPGDVNGAHLVVCGIAGVHRLAEGLGGGPGQQRLQRHGRRLPPIRVPMLPCLCASSWEQSSR